MVNMLQQTVVLFRLVTNTHPPFPLVWSAPTHSGSLELLNVPLSLPDVCCRAEGAHSGLTAAGWMETVTAANRFDESN